MASIVLPEGIQLLSGLEANRTSVIPDVGEPLVTTDELLMYVGDNVTAGGNRLAFNYIYPNALPTDPSAVVGAATGTTWLRRNSNYIANTSLLVQTGSDGYISPNFLDPSKLRVRSGSSGIYAPFDNVRGLNISASQARFTADAFEVQETARANAAIVSVNQTMAIPLTANTWFDCYITYNEDTDAQSHYVVDETAPVNFPGTHPYRGYIGSVYVDNTPEVRMFRQYGRDALVATQSALNGGTSTTYAVVGLSAAAPLKAVRATGYFWSNRSTPGTTNATIAPSSAGLGRLDISGSSTESEGRSFGSPYSMYMATPQRLYYQNNSTGANVNIRVTGYGF